MKTINEIVSTSLTFVGTTTNIEEFPTENLKLGSVVMDLSNETTYIWTEDSFVPICDNNDLSKVVNSPEDEKALVECNCKNCGAPLIISRYSSSTKCEYCGTTYIYK